MNQLRFIETPFSANERGQYLHLASQVLDSGDSEAPTFLNPALFDGCTCYQLLSICKDQELIAILIIGFRGPFETDAEETVLALDYAGRIAVALSNADWEDKNRIPPPHPDRQLFDPRSPASSALSAVS